MAYSVKDKDKHISWMRRHQRVRKHIFGSAEKSRLVVAHSNRHMIAQLIDDYVGKTLVSTSTIGDTLRISSDKKVGKAHEVGKLIVQRARAAGIAVVVFDRGDNKYHGRVAAATEGARGGGLSL